MSATVERAEQFHRLHHGAEPLRLVNVWDLWTARVAALAGAPALGTSSFAIALAHGVPDGEHVPWHVVRETVGAIVDAVEVPVTVDVEAGRGADPGAVATTVADVLAAGAVGVNLEDSRPDVPGALHPVDDQCARLAAAWHAAEAAGVPMFLNARCDVYFGADVAAEARLDAALRRAESYVAAGADGVFLPGLVDADELRVVTAELDAPVNVMLWPGLPPTSVLRAAGVRRISQGGSSFLGAVAHLVRTTEAYLADPSPEVPDADALLPALGLIGELAGATG